MISSHTAVRMAHLNTEASRLYRALLAQKTVSDLLSGFAPTHSPTVPLESTESPTAVAHLSHSLTSDTNLAPAFRGCACVLLIRAASCAPLQEAHTIACAYLGAFSNLLRQSLDLGDVPAGLVLASLGACLARCTLDAGAGLAWYSLFTLTEYLQRAPSYTRKVEGDDTVLTHVLKKELHGPAASHIVRLYCDHKQAGSMRALAAKSLSHWILAAQPMSDPKASSAPQWILKVLQSVAGRLASSDLIDSADEQDAHNNDNDHFVSDITLFGELCRAYGAVAMTTMSAPVSAGLADQTQGQVFAACIRLVGVHMKLACDGAEELLLPHSRSSLHATQTTEQEADKLLTVEAAIKAVTAAPPGSIIPGLQGSATYAERVRAETVRADLQEAAAGDEKIEVGQGRSECNKKPTALDTCMPPLISVLAACSQTLGLVSHCMGDSADANSSINQGAASPALLLNVRDTLVHTSRVCLDFAATIWNSDLRPLWESPRRSDQEPQRRHASWALAAAGLCCEAALAYAQEDPESLQAELCSCACMMLHISGQAATDALVRSVPLLEALLVTVAHHAHLPLLLREDSGTAPAACPLVGALCNAPPQLLGSVTHWLEKACRDVSISLMAQQAQLSDGSRPRTMPEGSSVTSTPSSLQLTDTIACLAGALVVLHGIGKGVLTSDELAACEKTARTSLITATRVGKAADAFELMQLDKTMCTTHLRYAAQLLLGISVACARLTPDDTQRAQATQEATYNLFRHVPLEQSTASWQASDLKLHWLNLPPQEILHLVLQSCSV